MQTCPVLILPLACDAALSRILPLDLDDERRCPISQKDTRYTVGEFAARAGVTVRTLQYYDRIGLLKPAARSEGGRRRYSETDTARLQQILTLKFIGLSLGEIKSLLTTDTVQSQRLLAHQKQVLEEKARQIATVIQTIEQAQAAMQATSHENINLQHFVEIIKAVTMSTQTDWFGKFFSDEEQQALAHRFSERSFAEQKQIGIAWRKLFQDIHTAMQKQQSEADVKALIARWDALMGQFGQDDPSLQQGLLNAYAQMASFTETPSDEVRGWLAEIEDVARFIQNACDTQ